MIKLSEFKKKHVLYLCVQNRHSTGEGTMLIREWEEQSRSAPTPTSLKLWQRTGNGTSTKSQTSFQDIYLNEERKR